MDVSFTPNTAIATPYNKNSWQISRKGLSLSDRGDKRPHNTKGNNMKKIDASRVLCEIDVIIGNGTGHHKLVKGKAYRLATLKADMRLTAS